MSDENNIEVAIIIEDLNVSEGEYIIFNESNYDDYQLIIVDDNTPNQPNEQLTIQDATPNNTTERKRKRKAEPKKWKQNIAHENRMRGLAYTNRKGEKRAAKTPKVMETCGCRFNCSSQVSEEEQVALFKDFLQLGDTYRQKAYLSNLITEKEVQRKRSRKGINIIH